jgi:hypothetical protein
VSLRSAPGRGSSLSARSRLPSTKRRLVRTRWSHPPPPCAQSLRAAAGIGRQQYLGALEFAGGSFAFSQTSGQFIASGLVQFDR